MTRAIRLDAHFPGEGDTPTTRQDAGVVVQRPDADDPQGATARRTTDRGEGKLGRLDSNQDYQGQNLACCRLHYGPSVGVTATNLSDAPAPGAIHPSAVGRRGPSAWGPPRARIDDPQGCNAAGARRAGDVSASTEAGHPSHATPT